MAKADVIEQALEAVESADLAFQLFVKVMKDVAGDERPGWLDVVEVNFAPVARALEQLGHDVRAHALPYLADLDRATNGGMGAVAPMVTTVMAGQSAPSRT